MMKAARYVRSAAALSLVLNAVLSVAAVALAPAFSRDTAENLTSLDAAGTMATLSVTGFIVAQLPFIIGVLGLSHLAGIRTPLLATIAGLLAVIGGFGHAVGGGAQLVQVAMASDTANHAIYVSLIDERAPLPLLILIMASTIGTVLGLILLGVAVLRAKIGPRWVPYALWVWPVVEFVGSNLTEWATLASALLYLGIFGMLAVAVWRSPLAVWASAAVTDAGAARPAESLSA
jgi:hypothetical protein